MKNDKNNKLLALTSAAMSLPGMMPQISLAQDGIATEKEFGYRYSSYSEAPVPRGATALGLGDPNGPDANRYEIDVHQFRFRSPINDTTEINIDFLTETLGGASPKYVAPVVVDDELVPIQVMSQATIEEDRNDINVSFSLYGESGIASTGISYSKENDYSSFGLRTKYAWFLNDKNTNIDVGLSGSQDFIDATQDRNALPGNLRVTDEEKTNLSISIGISQVLSKNSLIGSSFNLANYTGFMSDPYKQACLATANSNGSFSCSILPDSRPDRRSQWAWSNQYRHHFQKLNGSLHVDYRYFSNNWGVTSHTADLRWLHDFGDGWVLAPSIRYYAQEKAEFFQNWYESSRADGYYSSDYRLSNYNATSLRLKITKRFESSAIHLSYEDYTSSASDSDAQFTSPALVDFTHISIGFDKKF